MCVGMATERAGLFMEVRKRSAQGKAIEVIDVEPPASIDHKEKRMVPPLKWKMDFSMPLEGKLMGNAMKITRTSRRLAGMRPSTLRGSNSAGGNQRAQGSKGEVAEEVYASCWAVGKNSRLTSMDEKKEWAENILPPGARMKFKIYKGEEPGS